ncbi:g-protein coupled receptor 98 [Trichonephila clavipes]|nr:g-protein coupled receptor 98 [Trichonephila clavipes]
MCSQLTGGSLTPGTLELEEPIIVVSEGMRQMLVGVNRVGGTDGQIRCRYRTIPKTALPGVDYEPNFGEVIFEPGETRHVIKFRIINDLIREPLKNFQIELFDARAGPGVLNFRGLGTKKTSLVTIADDDPGVTSRILNASVNRGTEWGMEFHACVNFGGRSVLAENDAGMLVQ